MNDHSKNYVRIEDEEGNVIREWVIYERATGDIITFMTAMVDNAEAHEVPAL